MKWVVCGSEDNVIWDELAEEWGIDHLARVRFTRGHIRTV